MSFYDTTPVFSIYDLIDSLNQRQAMQQQQQQQQYRTRPSYAYPGFGPAQGSRPSSQFQFQQQPYYYFNGNGPYGNDEYDEDEQEVEEEEQEEEEEEGTDPRETLYRSLYGDGPYGRRRSSMAPRQSISTPGAQGYGRHGSVAGGSGSGSNIYQQQRPPIRRAPSFPKPSHPAESVVNFLNSLGANISFPEESLPTRKTLGVENTPTGEEAAAATESSSSNEILGTEGTTVKKAEGDDTTGAPPAPPATKPPLHRDLDDSKSTTKKSAVGGGGNKLNLHSAASIAPTLLSSDPLQISKPQLSKSKPFSPPINVYDRPEDYLIVCSIPGCNKTQFHVDFHPTSHELIIKGEVKNKYHDLDASNDQYLKVSEQRFGNFERNVKFPTLPKIDDDAVKASYYNGLLEISLPKLKPADNLQKIKRRIEIEEVEDEELQREAGLLS